MSNCHHLAEQKQMRNGYLSVSHKKCLKTTLLMVLIMTVIYVTALIYDVSKDYIGSNVDRSTWKGQNNTWISQYSNTNFKIDDITNRTDSDAILNADIQVDADIGIAVNVSLPRSDIVETVMTKNNLVTISVAATEANEEATKNLTAQPPPPPPPTSAPPLTTKVMEKLISSWTNGRLGNNMGIHAISLGLAEMNGYKPIMHRNVTAVLGEYFDLQTPTMDEETENLPWTDKWPTDYMQEEYRHWNEPYIRVLVYLNSWTFYHHIRSTILKEFTFKKALQDESQRILHQVLEKIQRNATFIGVHVRRGDYIRTMPEIHKGVIADKHYMDEAASIFRNRYKDAVFVVVSDDIPWCKENINSSLGDVFFASDLGNSSAGQDMATLVACNHTLMTFGTYGFWASYLCGGDVIHLANYTLPNTSFPDVQRYSAFFLPEWHGIAADLSPLLNSTTSKPNSTPTV